MSAARLLLFSNIFSRCQDAEKGTSLSSTYQNERFMLIGRALSHALYIGTSIEPLQRDCSALTAMIGECLT